MNITKLDSFNKGEMYNIVKGTARDGNPKSISIENGKLYIYHKQNPRGIFFMMRDAIKRYNEI